MNQDRWRRIENLFDRAVELPKHEQSSWIEANCPGAQTREDLRRLLEADNSSLSIDEPVRSAVGLLSGTMGQPALPGVGSRLGPYELIEEVGRGGMGTVFRARRADGVFAKEVAIKIVNSPGAMPEAIQSRFLRERDILARLDHPSIARILDGGSTASGVPYLAMEFVQGLPLTSHAESRRLSLDDRIALFMKVCSAVQYAHQHMVVHRDLKPSNILVDESGEPRLLDFGIAKLIEAEEHSANPVTIDGLRPMTPQYASPEQVRGEAVTAASDVYSLGAVLYELLSGRTAHHEAGLSPVTYAFAVCDNDPKPPSEAVPAGSPVPLKRLQGDLDHIVLRAMNRDPKLRYASVEQFSEDLRRYSQHLPVRAAAQTRIYRAWKFVRRNRTPILAGAVVCASLVAGFFASLHQARRAERRASQLRALTNAFIFDVHDAVEKLPGATEARRLILAKAVEQLEILRRDADDSESRLELASAFRKIGDAQGGVMGANLGDRAAAEKHYKQSRDLLRALLEDSPNHTGARVELAELLRAYANLERYRGDRKGAVALLNEALAAVDAAVGAHDRNAMAVSAAMRTDLSDMQRSGGEAAPALDNSEQAVRLMEAVAARDASENWQRILAAAYASLAKSKHRVNDLPGALDAARKNTRILEKLLAAQPLDRTLMQRLLLAHGHEGDILGWPGNSNLGDRAGSEASYRKAVEISEKLVAADEKDSRAKVDLAIALTRLGNVVAPDRHQEALDIYGRGLVLFERLSAGDPGNAMTVSNMAYLLRMAAKRRNDSGDMTGALEYLRRSQSVSRSILANKPAEPVLTRMLFSAMEDEAMILKRTGRAPQARAIAARLLAEANREVPGRDPFNLAIGRARGARLMAEVAPSEHSCRYYVESLRLFDSVKADRGFGSALEQERKPVERAAANCPPEPPSSNLR